jgi:hypothetical protein
MCTRLEVSSIEGGVICGVDDVIGIASSFFGDVGVVAINVEATTFSFLFRLSYLFCECHGSDFIEQFVPLLLRFVLYLLVILHALQYRFMVLVKSGGHHLG